MKYLYQAMAALCVIMLAACDDIVDYGKGYTPADQIANSGVPVIEAVYDIADTACQHPITTGTLGQTVMMVGKNLNHVEAVSFNTVLCDLSNVYTMSTRAIVQIPQKLSMEKVHQIAYTTEQGTAYYDFMIPFPDLIISEVSNEFMWGGGTVLVSGQHFDLYDFAGGTSTVTIGGTPVTPTEVTSTSMTLTIPEGIPDNSSILFSWQDTEGKALQASLPYRPTNYLLYGDFSGVQVNSDGPVQVAPEVTDGYGNLHFTGSYDAWSWNTIDISCNMIEGVTVDDVQNYVFKFELQNDTNFPVTENTGLQFCFNWGDTYAWNPANGLGINTFGGWLTVTLPLAGMATKGISEPGKWQTLRIVFQPHTAYEADFRIANMRIVPKS